MAVSANDEPTTLDITEDGAKGLPGTDGTDGAGFNQVRYSKINNPLCHLFKTNQLANASAPTNTDADVTATRATIATHEDRYGVVQDAAINEIREEASGFLIESAGTTECLYSDDFVGASWAEVDVTPSSNTINAPDGTLTADTLDATVASGYSTQNIAVADDSTSWVGSVYLKQGTAAETTVRCFFTGGVSVTGECTFDWATLTGSTTQGNEFSIKSLDNGWVRVTVTIINDSSGNTNGIVRIHPGKNGGTTGTCYAWGAQFENTNSPSSYIKTVASSATRSADSVGVSVLNNMISAPFSISARLSDISAFTGSQRFVFSIPVNSGFIALFYNSASNSVAFRCDGGTTAQVQVVTTPLSEDFFVASCDGVNVSLTINGVTATTPFTDQAIVDTAGDFFIFDATGAAEMNGNIKDFRLYDFALNADEITYLGGV